MIAVNFETGQLVGDGVAESTRKLSELAHLFRASVTDSDSIVYKTFASPEPQSPDLMVGTTVLHPGRVGDEFFMTRGHFHVKPERGETCVTLSGTGVLLLANRQGQYKTHQMEKGDVQVIDGSWAHRVVNTGPVPLVFLVTWMSDCGHDYETIEREGLPVRIVAAKDGWEAVRSTRP